ncbi:hypothetical protein LC087_00805 [Bacillus carboniphilus]|uniref:Uncharacterized protein n=1 Tax=Bacillus carboniphilus TaxID=86663 RepID=A0ABY9JTT3_9BACI|nr:hypothetical protein [Bacillus carboniphilus]WLR42816.1 hypothetical protein LC087_00805 [Bacillus carboniphilus]
MLKRYSQEDFYLLEDVAFDRMHPTSAPMFLWGAFAFGSLINGIFIYGVYGADNPLNSKWSIFATVCIVSLVIQFIFTLLFSKESISYKFQKSQSLFNSVVAVKMSLDTYVFLIVFSEAEYFPDHIFLYTLFLCIGGILYMVISTMRGIKRVQQGHFREGGKGLYNFSESKTYVSLPIIFGATMMGGAIARTLSDSASLLAQAGVVYFFLFSAVVLQYTIAFAIPEFFLVTYGKFRFESFHVPRPKPALKDTPREVIMAKNPSQRGKASKKGNPKKARRKKK